MEVIEENKRRENGPTKGDKFLKQLLIILITITITFVVTIQYVRYTVNKEGLAMFSAELTEAEDFSKLKKVYQLVKGNYYQDVDYATLEQAAIRGLVDGLGDQYSYYMDEEEFASFNEEMEGTFGGIGLYLQNNTQLDVIQVISPLKDTPGYKADIRSGDYIIAVDGVEYKGSELSTAVNKMKGEIGTTVNLTIIRGNEQLQKTLTRELIDINKMEYEILDGNIGYIAISLFDENVSTEFKEVYDELLSKNISGLIIDLRDNPGGFLTEVVKIADMLVPEGTVVYTIDNKGQRFDLKSNKDRIEIPLVILVNEGSASASEILSAAVQDYKVGTIVGTNTYGKGLVQTVKSLDILGENSAIKLTTSEYFTPNGNKINKIGVKPDVEVELSEELKNKIIIEKKEDNQLQKAIEILKK